MKKPNEWIRNVKSILFGSQAEADSKIIYFPFFEKYTQMETHSKQLNQGSCNIYESQMFASTTGQIFSLFDYSTMKFTAILFCS